MNWFLKISNESLPLNQLNASECSLHLRSLACDELTICSSIPNLVSLNQSAELFFNDTRKFKGKCCDICAKISGSNEKFLYSFKNVWLDLQELPFMQEWSSVGLTDTNFNPFNVLKTKTLFGLNYSGQRIDSASNILEIVNYAKSKNIGLNLGDCQAITQFPSYEARDLTCAQALLRILRWSPDIVSFFDYSQETPILNLKKRSSLTSKSLQNSKIKSIQYSPCRDLQLGSVNIIYEKTHSIDGEYFSSFYTDKYPENPQTDGKNSLSFTIELSGNKNKTLIQKIKTQNIDADSIDWWKSKTPFLNDYEDCTFTIDSVKRVSSLPRELVSGTIMEWMLKSVEEDVISAEISILKNNIKLKTKKVSIKLIATNASTQTYSNLVSSQESEPTPIGVAKNLYDSLSDLQYKGSVKLADIQNEDFFASVISLPNKFENAAVTDSKLDIFSGNLTLNFGPQNYLQASDFIQLYRIPKLRNLSNNTSRNSAKEIKDAPIELSSNNNQTDTFGFDSKINFLDLFNPDDETIKITLDPKLIEIENADMKPRRYAVIHNSELKYAYILSTEPLQE